MIAEIVNHYIILGALSTSRVNIKNICCRLADNKTYGRVFIMIVTKIDRLQ